MSIVEINLSRPSKLDTLVFETIGVMPAFGIVSLTGEVAEEKAEKPMHLTA
jgi:hypothetical protein